MITPTYSDNNITLTSPYLEDVSDIDSLSLVAKINCCNTEYTMDLDTDDVADSAIVVDGAELFSVTDLADGIYSFEMVITYDDGGVRREQGCMFVDNTTSCKVAEAVERTIDLELEMDLFMLTHASGCGCECTSFCAILERVWKKLGLIDCDLCTSTTTSICSEC